MAWGRFVLRATALALVYMVTARIGLTLAFAHGSVTPVWPPAGIAIGALLLFGRRMAIGVFVGALVVNLMTGAPLLAATGIGIGNTLEAVCATEVLRRLLGREVVLDRLAHVVALLAVGAAAATAVAATVGVTSLCATGTAPWASYGGLWWVWWLGDATGVVVMTPLLLAWSRSDGAWPRGVRAAEAVAVLLLVALSTEIAFAWTGTGEVFRPLAFVPFPFVMWAAMRFGARGASTASLLAWTLAVVGTRQRSASFDVARTQVALLLAFQTIVSGSALVLAASTTTVRRHAARYRGLVEGLPDVVARITRSGTILALHAPRHIAIDAPSLIGRSLGDLLPPEIARAVASEIDAVLGEASKRVLDLQPVFGGVKRAIEARFVASGHDEITVVCRDVTELRATQAKLLVSERLASVGLLAAGVAHEINNPLTWVIGNIDLARRERTDPSAAEHIDQLLADARVGADRIAGIVRDLLRIARPEGDDAETIDLRKVMDLSLKMAAHAKGDHVSIEREYGDAPPVRGSAARLGQVFLNVIVNALYALREVRDRPAVLHVSLARDASGAARIEVRDTGEGIPKEAMAHLFEPFFTTKPAGSGTGLGLAICQSIVSAHEGEMTIESEVGVGTVTRIVLPAAPAGSIVTAASSMHEVAAPPPSAVAQARRMRILVVDDEPDIVGMIAALFEDRYDVVTATHAREALARITCGEPIDAVLCDLAMPDLTGFELHDETKRTRPELAKRFVFMTGGRLEADEAARLRAQSLRHLYKPLDVDRLEATLEALLGGKMGRKAKLARVG